MYKDFCDRLSRLRAEREMSQAHIARALNRPQPDISKWEKGVIEPNLEDVVKLALFFHVTTDYLLGLSSSDCRGWVKLDKEEEESPVSLASR